MESVGATTCRSRKNGTGFLTMGEVSDLQSVSIREDWTVSSVSEAKRHKVCSAVCSALNLPRDLFTFIVSKLDMPLQMIFQLSCVCKTWNTFVTDPSFVKCFLQPLSQTPLYTFHAFNGLAAYDIKIKSWHKFPSPVDSKHFSAYNVCGAAGDWLLVKEKWGYRYGRDGHSLRGLCLANPTNRFLRRLPDFPGAGLGNHDAMGITLDENSKLCNIFVVCQLNSYSRKVYLYDFELNSWKELGAWQRGVGERMHGMTFYEGMLHSIVATFGRRGRFCISRFDGRKSRWQELSTQVSEDLSIYLEHLFEWQGHLMLIGGSPDRGHRYPRSLSASRIFGSIHIWQLDKASHVWVEIMRMPDHMVDYLYALELGIDHKLIRCGLTYETCKDQICLISHTFMLGDEVTSKCRARARHVMCDLSKTLWWDVPEPPFSYADCIGFSVLLPKLEF